MAIIIQAKKNDPTIKMIDLRALFGKFLLAFSRISILYLLALLSNTTALVCLRLPNYEDIGD